MTDLMAGNRRATFVVVPVIVCAAALTLGACSGSGGARSGSSAGTGARTSPTVVARTTTTTPKQGSSIAKIDFRNYTYEDRACGTKKAVRFTDGAWRQDPTSVLNFCGMSVTAVAFADVTGDGAADAIVTGSGSYGGGTAVSLLTWTTVFAESPTGPVNRGYFDGEAFPPYSASGGITLWSRRLGPNDAACCPSFYQKATYKYASTGRFTQAGTALVPASQLPTSTSSTSTPSGSAPCTRAAVQAAITSGVLHGDPTCVGTWAVAFPTDSDRNDFTLLLRWNGSAWKVDESAATDCNNGLPAPIYPDCASN
jgi:hypothetical protein